MIDDWNEVGHGLHHPFHVYTILSCTDDSELP